MAKTAGREHTCVIDDNNVHSWGSNAYHQGDEYGRDKHRTELLVDAGLLHNMQRERILTYRDKISHLLKPGGQFMLAHWESMNDDDRLNAGPRRSTRSQIEKLFSGTFDSLTEFGHFQVQTCDLCNGQVCERNKEPACSEIGPQMSIAFYWFTK